MKEIFDNYIKVTFGSDDQVESKFPQFTYNYFQYFPQDINASILDIGVGRGEMLSLVRSWGYRNYLGIDISPSVVAVCNKYDLNVILIEDTQIFLKDRSNEYDLITLLDVLEHIPKQNIVRFLSSIRESMRVGGKLIIQVPNLQAPEGYLHRYNDITHEVGFVEHSLAQVLFAAGFENFYFQGFEHHVMGSKIEKFRKFIRAIHWRWIRFLRRVHGNLDPFVLHPVFFAVVTK